MNNKKRKTFIRVVCVFLAVLMLLSLVISVLPALAVSQEEIDGLTEQKEELERKSSELQAKIDSMEQTNARYIDRKAVIDQRIQCNREEIDVIEQQIAYYDARITETREQLAEATSVEEGQFALLCRRMRNMEESGTLGYISVLLKASNLTDLLSKITDISAIMNYDREVQDEYVAARTDVQALEDLLEEQQATQSAIGAELTLKQEQMEAQTVAAYTMIAELEADIQEHADALAENEAEEEKLQKEIDEKMEQLRKEEEERARKAAEEEARRKAAEQQQKQQQQKKPATTTTTTSVVAAGSFTWPVACYLITSEYGYRVHPLQGVTKFHSGVDIGAQQGQAISAAAAGTIVAAATNSSYGNYVLINHGGGNSTLYAHMSSMAVSEGQSVSQGQVIGYVGSTGWSTGPHLHFEIRLNGSTVDPLQFFSGYTIYEG